MCYFTAVSSFSRKNRVGFEMMGDEEAFRILKAVKRRCHEIIADTQEGEGTFETFDNGRTVTAYPIDRRTERHHLRTQVAGALQISGKGGIAEIDIKPRMEIGTSVHSAMPAEEDGFAEEFLRPDEKGPVRSPRSGEVLHFPEIDEVS